MYKYYNKVYIDINDIFNITPDTVTVEGIPVEMSIYENKANIKVIAYDEFRILKDFHDIHGNIEYKLVDADDYIGPVKTVLEKMISSDKGRFELPFEMVYYSFVMKYFRIILISNYF